MKNKATYLRDIPLEDALRTWESALQQINKFNVARSEEIFLNELALGRVLAEPVWASSSSPPFHSSAMDGFAVKSLFTSGASPSNPISLQCHPKKNHGREAEYINTGRPLPEWSDAVIPIEYVESVDLLDQPAKDPRNPDYIRIREPVVPWSHVRPMGEDIIATQLVLLSGQVIRPVDLGVIAASGNTKIMVVKKPKVVIIPTGSELIPIGEPINQNKLIEYNSLVIAAQIIQWGGEAIRLPIIGDDPDAIRRAIRDINNDFDLVLLNAGSAAGSEDYASLVIEEEGELLVHGIAVRPGHPVILGILRQGIPIIGVPGYPVSAALTCEILVKPLIDKWLGRNPDEPIVIDAQITQKITSPAGDAEYLRVLVGKVGEQILAAPLSKKAGVITSLAHADGIVIIPRGIQGLHSGDKVSVRLYSSKQEIDQTIFCIGSHEIILDLLAQFLAKYKRRFISSNVGSLGGLISLQRGHSHLAGSHLMDPESGIYNLTFVQKYLADTPVKAIRLVKRDQGLIVAKGNPKGIADLGDLVKDGVRFVNRQMGAGTRILLDYHLDILNIPKNKIIGYEYEEYSHLTLAASIMSGKSDCGLGTASAAKALNLDFIPMFQENYDLIIPGNFYETYLLEPIFHVLKDRDFNKEINLLPGYDTTDIGKLIFET